MEKEFMLEYEPIFPAGFHDITIDDLDECFVIPFDNNSRRRYLTDRLKFILSELKEIGINFEIWIDGSYATKKPDPADVDIFFSAITAELNAVPKEKMAFLADLISDPKECKLRYGCELYFAPRELEWDISAWRGWFGFSRDNTPKGIPRLTMEAMS
jgi:hypothetical protein